MVYVKTTKSLKVKPYLGIVQKSVSNVPELENYIDSGGDLFLSTEGIGNHLRIAVMFSEGA